jgi:phosphate transport system protein
MSQLSIINQQSTFIMTHLETDLKTLKSNIVQMWALVINQLSNTLEALASFDKELACEVLAGERKVDAFELKINMDCENILALFNPLANDLRLVLAVMRINYNLERIGDYARSVAKMIAGTKKPFNREILEKIRIIEMLDMATDMLTIAMKSFEHEDEKNIKKIYKHDDELDKINKDSDEKIAKIILQNKDEIIICLHLYSSIKKIERVGDQAKNIAEEIVFYLDAKVLRHKKKKEKLKELSKELESPKSKKGT